MRILFPLFLVACVSDSVAMDGGMDAPTSSDTGSQDGAMTTGDAGMDSPSCGVIGLPCCGATCNGGAVCTAGNCACQGMQTACGMSCVDVSGDAKNCGACGHDCLGGQCTAGKCQPLTIATGQTAVTSIAVDPTSIYWARAGMTSSVTKAKLDGSNATPLYNDGGNFGNCADLVVDTTNVYFRCNATIYRCAIGGCNNQPAVIGGPFANSVTSLVIDGANNRLYFAVTTPYNTQTGGFVASIPLPNGGAHSRLVAADQPSPSSLRIQNATVFWLNAGTYLNDNPQYNGGLKKAPLGINQQATIIANETGTTDIYSLALDANTAFWGGGSLAQVRTVALGGGTPATFANAQAGVSAVIVDATDVYWTESNAGIVRRCNKGNCPTPALVAGGQAGTYALVQDAVSIAWGNYQGGEIRRLAK